ncbi:hypothetical protein Despr_2533 [Desulfobulbus propionicus DSM 2032]|jgi:hypothetical protein|uniref:Uncharacterized protein n=1 Tax=Desulfobulbus propionicus (strain ATCC 33891 / DSM 2032 / VKM B-1956 / 1pr3) TaxID=577650 RepID=A0A7U3YNK4_DESPD|nr:hypothetical protein [Desulfobulbus propionicus]ADW18670.1 hypothetical protein Despr_2533 [Desulfobulbus propionicus DSM 2032]
MERQGFQVRGENNGAMTPQTRCRLFSSSDLPVHNPAPEIPSHINVSRMEPHTNKGLLYE